MAGSDHLIPAKAVAELIPIGLFGQVVMVTARTTHTRQVKSCGLAHCADIVMTQPLLQAVEVVTSLGDVW